MLTVAHRTPATTAECEQLMRDGARIFELDVQVKDYGVVVSHFLPVHRRLRWLEHDRWSFRRLRAAARDPLLHDVLDMIPHDAGVLLDLKDDSTAAAQRLNDEVVTHLEDPARFYASSKNWDALATLRSVGVRTWRSVASRRDLDDVLRVAGFDDNGVTVRHSLLTDSVVPRLRAVTPLVVAWTVNDPARAQALADIGVQGITSDNPQVFRRLSQS